MKPSPLHKAKPFLKWSGGKTQLINAIENALPADFAKKEITFIEPFVGSGAVMFWMLNNFPNIKKMVINDINSDLINSYKIIRTDVDKLIKQLKKWEKEYHQFANNNTEKKGYYYEKREFFNTRKADSITQAALLIFLNRTCFNGLYRVNKNNVFNVPIGSYTAPMICDLVNLKAVSYNTPQN